MSTSLHAALIGYGYAGKTFHAPLIQATAGLRLHCVGSSSPDKVRADWPDVEVEDDVARAITRDDVDLVVIASPNATHFDLAAAALRAGKHVVCDKPFTVTLAEARALDELARQQQRLLSVFHNRRWDADFLTLRELLRQNRVGEVLTFESRFDRFRPEIRVRWREQDVPGGGLWYDLGPHLVDQALQLFGRPRAVAATLLCQRPGATAVDWFEVRLDYERLQVLLGASMLVAGGTPRFAVFGTQGSWIKYGLDSQEEQLKRGMQPGDGDWGEDSLSGQFFDGSGTAPQPTLNRRGDYRNYYRAVVDAINGRQNNPVPASEAIAVMEIIELAQQAHTEQRVLLLPEQP